MCENIEDLKKQNIFNIKNKFKDVKFEPDTKLLFFDYLIIDGLDCKYEIWSWDGIQGESLIFLKEDLKNFEKSFFETIVKKLKKENNLKLDITLKSSNQYFYVNFGFKIL